MNGPTVFAPWFVVQKLKRGELVYFYSVDSGDPFTSKKAEAMLFTNLHSASRVALAEVAEVRALFSDDDAKEFGR